MAIYHLNDSEILTVPGPCKVNVGGGGVPTISAMPAPTVASLNPDTAECGAADLQLIVSGENFNEATKIVFNGYDEPTALLSPTQVRTNVKPSLFAVAATCPVGVRTGGMQSSTLDFTFTEPAASRSRRRG